jgi:hypothetical protein
MAFALTLGTVFAQNNEKSEKQDLFPQGKEFAFGLDMANFAKSLLNSITNPNSANTVIAFESDFFGKYFISESSALRLRLGIGINNSTKRKFIRDDYDYFNNPFSEKQVVDVWKQRRTDVVLGIGFEYRKLALWRVQGYVGGEVFGGVKNHLRDNYEYGNPITEINQNPTKYAGWANAGAEAGSRILDSKTTGFTLGAAVFVGADLFIAKNVSLGVEFTLEGAYTQQGERSGVLEVWQLDEVRTKDKPQEPVTSAFGLNPKGGLNLMIYF